MKSLKIQGKDFIFSDFMSCVEQVDIDYFNDQFCESHLIAACGVDPEDKCMLIVTFLGEVSHIRHNQRLIPASAEVIMYGRGVRVKFENGTTSVLDSKAVIEISTSLESSSQLYINDNYLFDINTVR